MKQAPLYIALVLLVGVPLWAEEGSADTGRDAKAMEILEQVDSATKAVSSVRYKASSKPDGFATNFAAPAEGEAALVGLIGGLPEKFYAHVTTTDRQGETVELTGGGNGDEYFIIDHQGKKAYADMDPAVLGSGGRALQGIWMIEFVHDAPFDDELNADSLKLLGEEEVGGEPCYKIGVVYSGGQGEAIWYFSKNDYLPRKRVRKFSDPSRGEGSIENTIMNLEVEPELDEATFAFKLPKGYEQIDDFMP